MEAVSCVNSGLFCDCFGGFLRVRTVTRWELIGDAMVSCAVTLEERETQMDIATFTVGRRHQVAAHVYPRGIDFNDLFPGGNVIVPVKRKGPQRWFTLNEIREIMDLPPIEGGDTLLETLRGPE